MKSKVFLILAGCALFMFLGCASGPKNIKFNELSSKTFALNNVFYMTIVDPVDANFDLPNLFGSLPIQAVVQQIETKYGINVDASLFSNSNIKENISRIKSHDLAMRNYYLRFETAEPQRVTINFNKLDSNKYTIEVYLSIIEEGKTAYKSDFITTVPVQ